MRLGVISDIHGNIPSLHAVLDALEDQDVDQIACCGDIIGVLGWPEECIRAVDEECDWVVFGNHDARMRDDFVYQPSFPAAHDEHKIVTNHLFEEDIEWLSNLPARIETEDFMLAHSWPKEFQDSNTSLHGFHTGDTGVRPADFTKAGRAANGKVVLLGHTHDQHAVNLAKFKGIEGLVLNPGSVGVPWYGEAEYAVVNTRTQEYDMHSVEYDTERVEQRLDVFNEHYDLRTWPMEKSDSHRKV